MKVTNKITEGTFCPVVVELDERETAVLWAVTQLIAGNREGPRGVFESLSSGITEACSIDIHSIDVEKVISEYFPGWTFDRQYRGLCFKR